MPKPEVDEKQTAVEAEKRYLLLLDKDHGGCSALRCAALSASAQPRERSLMMTSRAATSGARGLLPQR